MCLRLLSLLSCCLFTVAAVAADVASAADVVAAADVAAAADVGRCRVVAAAAAVVVVLIGVGGGVDGGVATLQQGYGG